MSNFFILGLPRSRTAWLANFMTYDGFHCLHDGLNGCNSMAEYKTKLGDGGDSNTGLALFNFRHHFPTAPTVIIDHNIQPAVQYAQDHYGVDIANQLLDMKDALDHINGLHIPFDRINAELPKIWKYLTNDAPYDAKRAELLISLDVSVVMPYNLDEQAAENLRRERDATILHQHKS